MAKIARLLDHALARRRELGTPGTTSPRVIAAGDGWTIADVVCTCGPGDRPFEERHDRFAIALVVAGTFQYRSSPGRALMTPGSLMLGNAGQPFECGHAHGEGDRCVCFWYDPDLFDRLARDVGIARDAGVHRSRAGFTAAAIPPLSDLSPLVASAALGVAGTHETPWEEISVRLAARALQLSAGRSRASSHAPPDAEARVTHAARTIDRYPERPWTLGSLAQEARLSRYHFLRAFDRLTGVTPHQYVLRARLRHAALHLVTHSGSIIDAALDCGFGDISNFNRAFRNEFGLSPSAYRQRNAQPRT